MRILSRDFPERSIFRNRYVNQNILDQIIKKVAPINVIVATVKGTVNTFTPARSINLPKANPAA